MVRMSVPDSSNDVAKLWRSVWQLARLLMCAARGCGHGLLPRSLVEVVEDGATGSGVRAGPGRGEDVLPGEARPGLGELEAQGVREVD
jgi:hypothetical protein